MNKNFAIAIASLLLCQVIAMPAEAAPAKGSVAKSAPTKAPAWSAKIKIPHRSWIPLHRPREVLLCVHGLGFNSESFSEFGHVMAGRGMAVYAVDVRGFGAWYTQRSLSNEIDFEACLTDIESALKNIRAAYPGVPVFLVGESMGGAIAMRAVSRYPALVDGLISSVPSSERYGKWSTGLMVGARYAANKNKPMDITPEVIERATSNPTLQNKWAAEKGNRMDLSPKELKQFNDFMKGNYDAAALIEKTPVLLLAGFKDKLVKPEGTVDLFNALSVQDKLLMVVGDGEHLLLEENQMTDQLSSLLYDWIRSETIGRGGVTAHE